MAVFFFQPCQKLFRYKQSSIAASQIQPGFGASVKIGPSAYQKAVFVSKPADGSLVGR